MPELPEVETVRRVLESQLKGRSIQKITVENPCVIARPGADEFCSLLTGQGIAALSRRGKFLILKLESGDRVILHLRMTGCLLVAPPEYPAEKHTHLRLHLSDGNELRFSDMRRFGRFWLIRKGESDTYSGIDKLGLEPFDTGLDAEYLRAHFGKSRRAIKTCLPGRSLSEIKSHRSRYFQFPQ